MLAEERGAGTAHSTRLKIPSSMSCLARTGWARRRRPTNSPQATIRLRTKEKERKRGVSTWTRPIADAGGVQASHTRRFLGFCR